jgi:RES domain-containing protein
VRAWRITREIYRAHAISGEGAARVGNRWNSPGVRIAYTSTSRPLAVLEMLVHVTRDTIPENLLILPINVPDSLVQEAAAFPRDWNALPYSASARRFGDRWAAERRSAALLVPSVVLPAERNLLINPVHPDYSKIAALAPERFQFDRRLLR